MSDELKENVCQGLVNEGHLLEIMQLFVNKHLFPWLSTEEARQELINDEIAVVIGKTKGSISQMFKKTGTGEIKLFYDKGKNEQRFRYPKQKKTLDDWL